MPITLSSKEINDSNRFFELCQGRSAPVFVRRDDGSEIVIMDMPFYRRELALSQIFEKLAEGEEQIAAGREQDAFRALAALKRRSHV